MFRKLSLLLLVFIITLGLVLGGTTSVKAASPSGNVWACGHNMYGQLGNNTNIGTSNPCPTPTQVDGLTGVISVAGGKYHSLALKSDGTVWAWGLNNRGQLGNSEVGIGESIPNPIPTIVNGLDDIVAIAAGGYHSMALKSDGTVWAWGANNRGQLGNNTNISTSNPNPAPVQVSSLEDVTAIAAGTEHSLAVKSDGTVWAWGFDSLGELGNLSHAYSTNLWSNFTPAQVIGLEGVVAISAGDQNSLALKSDGTVWAWGQLHGFNGPDRSYGMLVTSPHPYPSQVNDLENVMAIAAGHENNLALKSDGTVWYWGEDYYSELGNNSDPAPARVSGLADIAAVSASARHYLAVKSDGTAWAWGLNSKGQLGNGSNDDNSSPTQMSGLTGVIAVSAGLSHSLVVTSTTFISVSTGAHGSITPGSGVVNEGDTPTFAITPDTGYHISDVQVDGVSIGTISSYTFAPVHSNHTISASFTLDSTTTPVLVDYDIAPRTANAGDIVIFSYTIDNQNPTSQNVNLGAMIRDPALNYFNDADANVSEISAAPGTATYTRTFRIPEDSMEGAYVVYWGIWSNISVSNYQIVWRNDYLNVVREGETPINHMPVTASDSYDAVKDSALTVSAPGVLGNDTDADGDTLTAALVTGPSHGTLILNADGSFVYTPAPNYAGTDSFTYRANDTQSDSNLSTVSITVTNMAPVAVNDSYELYKDTSLTVVAPGVLANDTDANDDALTATIVLRPSHGTLTLNSDGSFIYTPAPGFHNYDLFVYRVSDGIDSRTATVYIDVSSKLVPGGTTSTFGLDEGVGVWYEGAGKYNAQRFQNTVGTGILTKIEVLIAAKVMGGNVRMAIYSDDNGSPGSILVDDNREVPVVEGWVSYVPRKRSQILLTEGEYYWLVFNMSEPNIVEVGIGPESSHIWSDFPYSEEFQAEPPELSTWCSGLNQWQPVMRATIYK